MESGKPQIRGGDLSIWAIQLVSVSAAKLQPEPAGLTLSSLDRAV